jgi:hypothetical protein
MARLTLVLEDDALSAALRMSLFLTRSRPIYVLQPRRGLEERGQSWTGL